MTGAAVGPGPRAIVAHVSALAGGAGPDQLLELRWRRSAGGMGQRWFPAPRPDAAATSALVLGQSTDVFLGVCPRIRREGTRGAVAPGWALWADCDGPAAAEALTAFSPPAAIVVRSGTEDNCHAYWPLTEPLAARHLEDANRRLAAALGADAVCAEAARVLRVPGTRNHKHDPPAAVTLETFTGERLDPGELLAALPAPTPTPPVRSGGSCRAPIPDFLARPTTGVHECGGDDPLRGIDPAVYVSALTGQALGRDRKVSCPGHRDRTPSLHVYETPADGWFCFGCRHGGDVYDLGAQVLGLCTRGGDFLELRRRLYELLLAGEQPPATRRRRAFVGRG